MNKDCLYATRRKIAVSLNGLVIFDAVFREMYACNERQMKLMNSVNAGEINFGHRHSSLECCSSLF